MRYWISIVRALTFVNATDVDAVGLGAVGDKTVGDEMKVCPDCFQV